MRTTEARVTVAESRTSTLTIAVLVYALAHVWFVAPLAARLDPLHRQRSELRTQLEREQRHDTNADAMTEHMQTLKQRIEALDLCLPSAVARDAAATYFAHKGSAARDQKSGCRATVCQGV